MVSYVKFYFNCKFIIRMFLKRLSCILRLTEGLLRPHKPSYQGAMHDDLLPIDLGEQPAGDDVVAGPLNPTVHLVPGLFLTAQ